MADRHASSSRVLASGISKARSGMTSSSHGVRRNLFQSQLTRRPTANSPPSPDSLHLDVDAQREHQHQQQNQFQPQLEAHSPDDHIVVRDHNGEIELDDPPTPPFNDAEDMEDRRREDEKERQRLAEAVRQHQIGRNSVPAQPEGKDPFPSISSTSSKCSAKHMSPVVLMTKTKRFASSTELLEAVKASLRAKVAALDEDNWLYEREELPQQHQ
ncbi:481111ba-7a22-487f-a85b-106445f10835 [Thermothielavioides terrestris]|uniref:Uncharacterized protein n=2 Tax=Thermothielavioides terrestris TaxID=2587410 RepID=G2QUP9_THETT|nr:uncharacterized protein THITE_154383 [Thermothielavioides terrestris NRRL 8126]AEO62894.1 hypothetical protein THITE_154383 [Thermothielavioides terrestris NRRL 8126]SPQ21616.1 481111ba-7a22-487f-a85b-106445f10835 [Thermothielavioides terrestris]